MNYNICMLACMNKLRPLQFCRLSSLDLTSPFGKYHFFSLDYTVKTHRALWPACDYMGHCYYIATGLARNVWAGCYLRLVLAPDSEPLCIISTQAPGPATVQKYS